MSWTGYYLDGKSAVRHDATITLSPSDVIIAINDTVVLKWPYRDIEQTQGFYAGEPVRLERLNSPEVLVIQDPAILDQLHLCASRKQRHIHNPSTRRRRVQWTAAAGVAAGFLAFGLYRWGIPILSLGIASVVPVAWEHRVGEEAVAQFASVETRCTDSSETQLIHSILTVLTDVEATSGYQFKLHLVDSPVVNALAAPGGQIVVFRGLLERTESAEQLAGVLAHEVQHVLRRHSTRMLTEQVLTAVLLSTLSGDFSAAMVYGLQAVQFLEQLQYSQAHETEADVEGLRLIMKAGLNPQDMIDVYGILEESDAEYPEWMEYFSSHPRTVQRVARLNEIAGKSAEGTRRLLPDVDWKVVREACRKRSTVRDSPSHGTS